jgi:hypothetical protein
VTPWKVTESQAHVSELVCSVRLTLSGDGSVPVWELQGLAKGAVPARVPSRLSPVLRRLSGAGHLQDGGVCVTSLLPHCLPRQRHSRDREPSELQTPGSSRLPASPHPVEALELPPTHSLSLSLLKVQ